jgi:PIN domain nuclease of toxin-antitoxin system
MKIIIDTHIFLWALAEPSRISEARRLEPESMANIIHVSSITIAELMIKSSIGKIHINFNPVELAVQSGFEMLDFTGEDALLLQSLPFQGYRGPRFAKPAPSAPSPRSLTRALPFEK